MLRTLIIVLALTWAHAAPAHAEAPTAPALAAAPTEAAGWALHQIIGATALAHGIRARGHLGAHLDPLGTEPLGDPALLLEAAARMQPVAA